MYRIEAKRGAVKNGRAEYHYWVNDKDVGTTIGGVRRNISGPPWHMVGAACVRAKDDGRAVHLILGVLGWSAQQETE